MPDLPGHGDSPLPHATFGKQEAQLIEDLLAEAEIEGGFDSQPAFLFGISQGGAVSLLTAARHPDRWAGVVSVATFTSLDEVVQSSAQGLHPAMKPIVPLISFAVTCGTKVRANFSPSEIRPIDAASHLDLPVMIAHGNTDRYIPISHGRRLFEKLPGPRNEFYEVEGAGHGWVLGKDAKRLYPAMCSFMLLSLDH
jgi:pimeloyl-ACP methyl ester carboxylesterase